MYIPEFVCGLIVGAILGTIVFICDSDDRK